MNREQALRRARSILDEEANAILRKKDAIGEPFLCLVEQILGLPGRVVVTGIGKSGIIGEKIAATLSSTGTPAFFLKPVDALHGDLGMVREGDLLIAISNSGETEEVLKVAHAAKALGVRLVAFTGSEESTLAHDAEIVIDSGVEREACPLGLAPTASTTTTLALGDALAMVLMEQRGFTREHYARFHPGGSLGERLRCAVQDLMRSGALLPRVPPATTLREALREMSLRENLGVTVVVDTEERLVGIMTDGDIRRILLSRPSGEAAALLARPVEEFMTRNPRVVEPEAAASEALRLMEVRGITSLAVVDALGRVVGLIHLHDILGRGKVLI